YAPDLRHFSLSFLPVVTRAYTHRSHYFLFKHTATTEIYTLSLHDALPIFHAFLEHGGNLLVLGGRPFTRAAYHDDSGWRLRDYSVRFIRQLSMDQFQTTPGSAGMEFQSNPDITISLPRFSWQRAFSPVIRLSAVDLYNRAKRSEEHTSELQSRFDLVCRLLLEKKNQ